MPKMLLTIGTETGMTDGHLLTKGYNKIFPTQYTVYDLLCSINKISVFTFLLL
jgi:hypothetical protein